MIIWIVLIYLKRLNCHLKMRSANCLAVHAQIQSTHATRVWDAFRCKTMADYHDIYLQLDVLLLADFFEKFRKTCLEFYSLDPLHYYTTPGLAWDAALRMSRVDLQPITDNDMCNFVENSIRNPSFPDTYDANLPNQNLIYLDANNLYGWAMSQS